MKFQYKPYEGSEPYAFISYCREDSALCGEVIEFLAKNGIRVWFDNAIHIGDMWPEVIANHLKQSKVCILLITDGFVNSLNCNRELNFSSKHKIPTVPILIEGTNISNSIDMTISSVQYIKLSRNEHLRLERLLESSDIAACCGKVEPEPIPAPAPPIPMELQRGPTNKTVQERLSTPVNAQVLHSAVLVDAQTFAAYTIHGERTIVDGVQIVCKGSDVHVFNGAAYTIYCGDGAVRSGERKALKGEAWLDIGGRFYAVLCGETADKALGASNLGVFFCASTHEYKCTYSSVLVLGADHIWPKGTLNDAYAAKENSLVIRRGDKFVVKDAAMDGTAYGTIVNRRIMDAEQECELQNDDVLQIGQTLLKFHLVAISD